MSGLAGVFVMLGVLWLLQLGLAWRQAMAFQRQVTALRTGGRVVSIGMARTRFRKVYVALAANEHGQITDALTLSGRTVFAIGKPEPRLVGARASALAEGRRMPDLPELVAGAAMQAAGFVQARRSAKPAAKSATKPAATVG